MKVEEMRDVLLECRFPDYEFEVVADSRGSIYLRAGYDEPDVTTGRTEHQVTRRWLLSPQMTRSEIVQTAFKCVMTSMEHRTREWFRYKGQAIFGPHFDVDVLCQICLDGAFDKREG